MLFDILEPETVCVPSSFLMKKKAALCVAGLAIGVGVAALTQYPVLETLGYLPDENSSAVASVNVADGSVANESVAALSPTDSDPSSKSPAVALQKETGSAAAATQKDKGKESESKTDRSNEISMNRLFSHGVIESRGKDLGYRLLKPATMVPGKRYPLVVFLHGAGERGSDNESHLKNGGAEFSHWVAQEDHNAYVLFPQCPKDDQWTDHNWSDVSHQMRDQPTKSMRAVLTLIDDMIASEPIDQQRIYAAGLSMGGYGVFDLLARRSRMFAAGVALCGGTDCSPRYLQRFKNVPLYVVHGDADDVVDVENSRNIVEGLKKLGGDPKYLELSGVNHDCWTPTFEDDKMFAWMFSNVRGQTRSRVATVETKKTKKLPVKDVAKATGNSTKSPAQPKPLKTLANSPAKDVAIKNQVAKSKARAADRVPAIKKPVEKVVTTKPQRKKVVVAKPPMKEAESKVSAKESMPTLLGKWNVTQAVHNGKMISAAKIAKMSLEFDDDTLLIHQGKKAERGIVSWGGKRMLGKQMVSDIIIRSTRKNVKPISGFYFFDGKELSMVWSAPGGKSPKSMKASDLADSRILKLKK